MKDLVSFVDQKAAAAESILLAIIGRLASWLSPIPIAVMTARAISRVFQIGTTWSTITAIALEIVGVSCTSLWTSLRDYNHTKRKSDPPAAANVALGLMITYFTVDLLIILAITIKDIQRTSDWSHLIAFLFPVMSGVGSMVLNLRIRHYRQLALITQEKDERKLQRKQTTKPLPKVEIATINPPKILAPILHCSYCDWQSDPASPSPPAKQRAGHMKAHPLSKRNNGHGEKSKVKVS